MSCYKPRNQLNLSSLASFLLIFNLEIIVKASKIRIGRFIRNKQYKHLF